MVDMRRLHKNSTDPPKSSDLESDDVSRDQHTRFGFGGLNPLKLMGGFVVCLMGLSVLFSVSVIFKDFTIWDSAADVAHGDASRILYVGPHRDIDDNTSEDVKKMLRHAIGSLLVDDDHQAVLVQYWAATKAGGKAFLLTTTNQPYRVYGHDRKLDLFRESSLQQKYYIDLAEDVSYGFPGLVFKTEKRQQTQDMNFYNPEDVRPRFGSNAIFPVEWGSFAVPVHYHTEGAKKSATRSTAKKKECVGVLEYITTKSMTSYDADMDLVEKALASAGFLSSTKIDSSTRDSSKKDAPTEMIEKKRSAAIDASTQTTIDAPTDAASSNKKQQKGHKRKLEHTVEIDTSTEATSSKNKGRTTQRIKYSSYNCLALCFGLKKKDARLRIKDLFELKKPDGTTTFDSVVKEVGITWWPNTQEKNTSASTSTLPETPINSRAPEIMLNTNRWGKQGQEQLTNSHSVNMAYLDGAPANVTPNMATTSLINPRAREIMLNTTWGVPVLGKSSGSFYMPYRDEAPANATPNIASSSLIDPRACDIMLNTTWGVPVLATSSGSFYLSSLDAASANVTPYMASSSLISPRAREVMLNTTWDEPAVQEQVTSSSSSNMPYVVGAPANEAPNLASSNETLIIPTAPEVPTGLGPAENAHWIHDTNKRHLERDFDVHENQNDYGQLPGLSHTEDQVMPSLVGAPVNGTSSYLASSDDTPNAILEAMAREPIRSPDLFYMPETDEMNYQGSEDPFMATHDNELNDHLENSHELFKY